jgi:hypothetical protein
MRDRDLVTFGVRELELIGFARREDVLDGCVLRMPKAYPIYDATYAEAVDVLKTYVARFENLYLVGRNGMHKYNNQDHSMLTAILAVENIFGAQHDLWAVNAEEEYHEEVGSRSSDASLAEEIREMARTQPLVPTTLGVNSNVPPAHVQAPAHAPAEM